jgi:hypothetical protein
MSYYGQPDLPSEMVPLTELELRAVWLQELVAYSAMSYAGEPDCITPPVGSQSFVNSGLVDKLWLSDGVLVCFVLSGGWWYDGYLWFT